MGTETDDLVKLGVEGFDELLNPPGLPRGSTLVVAGDAGTGKTTFLMEFLRQGVRESVDVRGHGKVDHPYSLYVTLEESAGNILRDYKHWRIDNDMDLGEAESCGHLKIIDCVSLVTEGGAGQQGLTGARIVRVVADLLEHGTGQKRSAEAGERRAKQFPVRVAIDSVMPILTHRDAAGQTAFGVRQELLRLKLLLEESGYTTLFSAEATQGAGDGPPLSTRLGDLEKFIARGVILLAYRSYGTGELVRHLQILKMRGRQHATAPQAYRIEENGIRLIGECM